MNFLSLLTKRCHWLLSTALAIYITFGLAGNTEQALAANVFSGTLNSVSITDSEGANAPPSAQFTHTVKGDIVSFDAGASSDEDGSIVKYTWDFGDGGTGSGATVEHTYTGLTEVAITLTVYDDAGGITIRQEAISLSTSSTLKVSFQPANSPVQDGFVADSGASFNSTAGYGWKYLPPNSNFYDYEIESSPDQSHDTVLVMPTQDGVWEYEVPAGTYSVTISLGDPKYPLGAAYAQAEGVAVIAGTLSESSPWLTNTVDVEVNDGMLTITFEGSGARRRLSWLSVTTQ